MKKYEKNILKKISQNLKKSHKIWKNLNKYDKIWKNIKKSQNVSNVVFQTWFCETGFCIAYFSGP